MKKVIFGLVLSLVAGSAFAQSASVSVNGDSVTVNNQAVAAGTNVSVNAGDVVASAAGEAMINYGACRVRVAAGAAHTIGNAADVCAAVAASRPAGAAARRRGGDGAGRGLFVYGRKRDRPRAPAAFFLRARAEPLRGAGRRRISLLRMVRAGQKPGQRRFRRVGGSIE